MPKPMNTTRVRRTDQQLIADLQAKIAQIKERAEKKRAKRDPALRHISAALRSIDKAKAGTKDPATHRALDEARATLGACLSLNRAAPSNGVLVAQPRRSSKATVDSDALLDYIRENPGQRGEQIASAFGISTGAMRPVMRQLIEKNQVKTKGERRGMSYHPTN